MESGALMFMIKSFDLLLIIGSHCNCSVFGIENLRHEIAIHEETIE